MGCGFDLRLGDGWQIWFDKDKDIGRRTVNVESRRSNAADKM